MYLVYDKQKQYYYLVSSDLLIGDDKTLIIKELPSYLEDIDDIYFHNVIGDMKHLDYQVFVRYIRKLINKGRL